MKPRPKPTDPLKSVSRDVKASFDAWNKRKGNPTTTKWTKRSTVRSYAIDEV